MTHRVHLVALAAQSKGATGVREHLREHRQEVSNILVDLSASVLLSHNELNVYHRHENDDEIIRIELFPLRAQREIWSALASDASPDQDAAVNLARKFLRVTAQRLRHDNDEVCLFLARIILSKERDDESEGARQNATINATFRRRMRRLILNQVQFVSPDKDDVACRLQVTPSSVVSTLQTSLRSRKHCRDEVLEDMRPRTTKLDSRKQKMPLVTSPAGTLQERPQIKKEIEDRASELTKQLVQLPYLDAVAPVNDVASRAFDILADVVNDVHTTYAVNKQIFQYVCKMLRIDSTSDEALAQITTYPTPCSFDSAFVDSNWSSQYAAIFLETSFLPKIRAADSVISRVLLQTVLRFGSAYPGILIDSLLLPLLTGDQNTMIGPAQAEAITRILRSLETVSNDHINDFLQKSLAAATVEDESKSRTHLLSNESALLVIQNILNTKPYLSPLTVEKIVAACEAVLERPEAEQSRSSLRFATVIFTLISKYPQQCIGHKETLEAIAAQLTSVIAKTTLRLLQKFKATCIDAAKAIKRP
ncbi:hypothetical protein PsorP6_003818 [Peronosclerospora sorghi]|uniref:Uncharacterized protein n=1 Tax=Peronosclerospora sorghi TaxID=230839 RepID=A0ACC0VL19_9STRA|nr:hypothetical protein PsorP6_003818 [Peronosclerospora sorghi]